MRSGMMGGIAVCCLLVAPISVLSSDVAVYVNDALVDLVSPAIVDAGSVLVPLEEFAPLVDLTSGEVYSWRVAAVNPAGTGTPSG